MSALNLKEIMQYGKSYQRSIIWLSVSKKDDFPFDVIVITTRRIVSCLVMDNYFRNTITRQGKQGTEYSLTGILR